MNDQRSRRHRIRSIGVALVCSILAAGNARATGLAEPMPRHRLVHDNLLALRLNPLGLEDQFSIGYRYRLYRDPGMLWRDGYVGLAFAPAINPAVARLGGAVEIKPLALLQISAGYYFVGWFGSFGSLQSYASPHEAHSDSDQDAGRDAGRNYAATGSELQLRAQLMGKAGPVVLRNDLSLLFGRNNLQGTDRLSYSPRIDAMVADGGWALTSDTDLLYLSRFGLVAGVRASVVHAFYDDDHYLTGESTDNPNTPTVRAGPLLAYMFHDRPGACFDKPTVILIVNWWLRHRYRTGADVSQALPYLVLGFRFEGEVWRHR